MFSEGHSTSMDRCMLWVKGAGALMCFYRGFSVISYCGDRAAIALIAISERNIFRLF